MPAIGPPRRIWTCAKLRSDATARRAFRQAFETRGLELIALNANGNQLHPTDGARQSAGPARHDPPRGRVRGREGRADVGPARRRPRGQTPNWVVSSWPPETQPILQWQWEEKLLPYWHDLARLARENGVTKLCVEIHGNQLVYNVPALLRLRAAIGPIVGANLDPSHLMWMGADPIAAVDALGDAILHCHAKDTFLNSRVQATTSLLENGPLTDIPARVLELYHARLRA